MALTNEMKEARVLLDELKELKALRSELGGGFPLSALSKLEDEDYKKLEALKGKL